MSEDKLKELEARLEVIAGCFNAALGRLEDGNYFSSRAFIEDALQHCKDYLPREGYSSKEVANLRGETWTYNSYIQSCLNKAKKFLKDIKDNYDCDQDSHKYNTGCRACEAEKLLKEIDG